MIVSSKVTAAYKQTPVLDYLTDRFTYRTRAEWELLLHDGRIHCNDLLCTPATLVTQGDTIHCHLPDHLPDDVNLDYQIVYEDEWLLGINKPANLRVHDKRRYAQANLIYHLRQLHTPPYPEATLINRLDKNTSGVVLAARTPDTLREMQAMFADGRIHKSYLALVHGIPNPAQGIIDQPIGKLPSLPGVYRFGCTPDGKTAVTQYQTHATYPQGYALLHLQPLTGRTHQLRVHLQAIGHPIVGDHLYQMDDTTYLQLVVEKIVPSRDLLPRQALHCAATTFIHPHTGQPCTLTAPLPPDMATVIQMLAPPTQPTTTPDAPAAPTNESNPP